MLFSFSQKKGFSLIELLVTMTVFMLLSAGVVINYRATTKSLSLSSMASLISSDIRRAQMYGISNIDRGGLYRPHGISFNITNNTSYMLFADTVTRNLKNDNIGAVCSGECLQKYAIKDGTTVTELCLDKKQGPCQAMRSIHIAFERPNPEPIITGVNNGGVLKIGSDAEITITTKDGAYSKTIIVWKTGLVSVE